MTDNAMSEELEDAETATMERARLRGKRLAHALVIGVAVAFIASSAWQIASAVFGFGVVPLGQRRDSASSADSACASGVRALAGALDRAGARSASAPAATADDASAVFRQALSPEWDGAGSVSSACAASRAGLQAWAALERLEIAEEQVARRIHADVEPLRRDLATHLPPDLR